jgi:Zn/Cd-binding protein ZinT
MNLREINANNVIISKTDDGRLLIKKNPTKKVGGLITSIGVKVHITKEKDKNTLSSKITDELNLELSQLKHIEFIEATTTENKQYSYLGKYIITTTSGEVTVHNLFSGFGQNGSNLIKELSDFAEDINRQVK